MGSKYTKAINNNQNGSAKSIHKSTLEIAIKIFEIFQWIKCLYNKEKSESKWRIICFIGIK